MSGEQRKSRHGSRASTRNKKRDEEEWACLTVYVQAIDAALMNNKLQEQSTRIELNRLQLSCLKITAFVGIKADIPHPLEFRPRICRAGISFHCSANKNFDAGGDFALM